MSAKGPTRPPAPGHDILARYLRAYASARQMSDLERPWGLGDDGLDEVWLRLTRAHSDPERLNHLITEELSDHDREHIARTLTPLLFAIPLRAYPSELRAVRSGPWMLLSVRHYADSEPPHKPERPAPHALPMPAKAAKPPARNANKVPYDEPVGFLPASLIGSFTEYLRGALSFGDEKVRRECTVSSGGRRRRVRVTILAHQRGVLVRFLERLPSPVDERA